MSKKKRRAKKQNNATCNRHHCLWVARNWNRPWARKLREHPYMVISIPMNTEHKMIHANISGIPVLPEHFCEVAYKEIDRLWEFGAIHDTDPLSFRMKVLIAILDCTNDATVKALKKQKQIAEEFEWQEFCRKLP
jgi:hypothetical protein